MKEEGNFSMDEKRKPLIDLALAGDSIKGSSDSSEALPNRVNRYGLARHQALQTLAYLDQQLNAEHLMDAERLKRILPRLRECGNYLVFNHYYRVDTVRLSKASFCMKHLLCPLCAIRRGAKSVGAYLERFEVIQKENPRLKPYLLTLTVKNGPDLAERFEHCQKSVRKYLDRRRDSLKKGRGLCELSKLQGGVFSYEVTNKGNGWHPHMHMVALVDPSNPIDFDPKRPAQSKLSKEWEQITGDSKIVDIRPITGDPAEGFVEVFKYALKFSELTPEKNYEAFKILSGKRLVSSFGLFWGVQVPEALTDVLLENEPYLELFYRYTPSGYSLVSTKEAENAIA